MNDLFKIFVAPGAVFDAMKEKVHQFPPLLALLLCVVVLTAAQPLFVSDQEYIDLAEKTLDSTVGFFQRLGERFLGEEAMEDLAQEIETATEGVTIEEMMDEAIEQSPEILDFQWQRISSAIFNPIGALIWLGMGVVILATYFNIAGTTKDGRRPWSDWFGFTLWSMMPVVLHYLLLLIATMVTGEVQPRSYVAPLAMVPGLQGNAFAINLTFGMIWAIWIQTAGLHRWLDRPIPICLLIALVPWVLQWLIASGVPEAFKAL